MSRDTQRSKVYKWEMEFFSDYRNRSVWTEDQCVKYINEAYKWWTSNKNAKTVKVKFENDFNSNRSSHFKSRTNTIKIQRKWATNPIVCSHELAHYIEHNDVCRGEASHGPVFMRVMLTLIDKFKHEPNSLDVYNKLIKINALAHEIHDSLNVRD